MDATTLTKIRCAGTFEGKRCNRVLFRTSVQPIRAGGVVEVKCGKCGELSFLVGGPDEDEPTGVEPPEATSPVRPGVMSPSNTHAGSVPQKGGTS